MLLSYQKQNTKRKHDMIMKDLIMCRYCWGLVDGSLGRLSNINGYLVRRSQPHSGDNNTLMKDLVDSVFSPFVGQSCR